MNFWKLTLAEKSLLNFFIWVSKKSLFSTESLHEIVLYAFVFGNVWSSIFYGDEHEISSFGDFTIMICFKGTSKCVLCEKKITVETLRGVLDYEVCTG